MAILVKCPKCGVALRAAEKFAGKKIKCPKCTKILRIQPASAPEEAPLPAESPAPEEPVLNQPAEEPTAAPLPPAPAEVPTELPPTESQAPEEPVDSPESEFGLTESETTATTEETSEPQAAEAPAETPAEEEESLDFDLDLSENLGEPQAAPPQAEEEAIDEDEDDLLAGLDLPQPEAEPTETTDEPLFNEAPGEEEASLDFSDLDLGENLGQPQGEEEAIDEDEDDLLAGLDLPQPEAEPTETADEPLFDEAPAEEEASLDFSDLDLGEDLGEPQAEEAIDEGEDDLLAGLDLPQPEAEPTEIADEPLFDEAPAEEEASLDFSDLDLGEDLSEDLGEPQTAPPQAEEEAVDEGEDDLLAGLDLPQPEAEPTETADEPLFDEAPAEEEASLDFSDLDLGEPETKSQSQETIPFDTLEDLDSTQSEPEPPEAASDTEELAFSEIDLSNIEETETTEELSFDEFEATEDESPFAEQPAAELEEEAGVETGETLDQELPELETGEALDQEPSELETGEALDQEPSELETGEALDQEPSEGIFDFEGEQNSNVPTDEPTTETSSATAPVHAAAGLTPEILDTLTNTRPWIGFMGLIILLGSLSTSAVAGFLLYVAISAMSMPQIVTGLALLIGPLLYLVSAKYLLTYSRNLGKFLQDGSSESLKKAYTAQRSFWKLTGIVTAIVVSFYFFLLAAIIGLSMSGMIGT